MKTARAYLLNESFFSMFYVSSFLTSREDLNILYSIDKNRFFIEGSIEE